MAGQRADSIKVLGARLETVMQDIEASLAEDARPGSIGADETFLQWCTRLADAGLVVDGIPFTLEDRQALIPLYQIVPTTIAEANRRTIVVMKAAQCGLTLWSALISLYFSIKFAPCVTGTFMPEQSVALDLSERRILPIIRSIPDVYRMLSTRTAPDGSTVNVGSGSKLTRIIGKSALLFNWTSSAIGTESRPMDAQILDEVQGMSLADIDRTAARMDASRIRFRVLISTANLPENDVHTWFMRGTRNTFHTLCSHCGAETDLSEYFPSCVQYNYDQTEGAPIDYVYVCPPEAGGCGKWLEDSQHGRYIPQVPNAPLESYHLAQTCSPTVSPRDLIEAWNRSETGDQRKNFANRRMGRPWLDRDQLPVTIDECNQCVADGMAAGLKWGVGGENFAGVDQMASHAVIVIARRMPDNRLALVWFEAIFQLDPWARVRELLDQYKVQLCCIEQLPSADPARQLQADYPGVVYLVKYSGAVDADMIVWGDVQSRSDRKTENQFRERFAVTLNQFKAMEVALFRVKNRGVLIPDPALLEQEVIERGERKRSLVVRDMLFLHWTKTALVVDIDDNTRKNRPRVQKVGLDPHASYAWLMCCVSFARNYGTSSWIMPGAEIAASEQPRLMERVEKNYPGLPKSILGLMYDAEPVATCGKCAEFDAGARLCTLRQLNGAASDPSCDLYSPR